MIGIFDSGIGGLSVWQELIKLMPNEEYIYIADTAYCPYGEKSADLIKERSSKISEYLINKGAAVVVVACNTATSVAISYLRETYNIPFVGMEPAIKPAILNSSSGVIGVLATANTLKGELYHNTLVKFGAGVRVIEKIGYGLVESVELGTVNSVKTRDLLASYIEPMKKEGADKIVLGCTHYPFLQKIISEIAGKEVEIINPAPAIARQTKHKLEEINYAFLQPISSEQTCKTSFITTSLSGDVNKAVKCLKFENEIDFIQIKI